MNSGGRAAFSRGHGHPFPGYPKAVVKVLMLADDFSTFALCQIMAEPF
jgi:hypothetical protein